MVAFALEKGFRASVRPSAVQAVSFQRGSTTVHRRPRVFVGTHRNLYEALRASHGSCDRPAQIRSGQGLGSASPELSRPAILELAPKLGTSVGSSRRPTFNRKSAYRR